MADVIVANNVKNPVLIKIIGGTSSGSGPVVTPPGASTFPMTFPLTFA